MENIAEQILLLETVQLSGTGGCAATASDGALEDGRVRLSLPVQMALHVSPIKTQVPKSDKQVSETKLWSVSRRCASEDDEARVKEEGEKLLEPDSAQLADSLKSKDHYRMTVAARKSKTELPAEQLSKMHSKVAEPPASSAPTGHSNPSCEEDSIVMAGNESPEEGQTLLPKMTIDVRDEGQLFLSATDMDSVPKGESEDCCFCDPCSYCYR